MTKQPLIISPSSNSDWRKFCEQNWSSWLDNKKETAIPDLTDVLTWLQNNFAIENYVDIPLSYYGFDEVFDYIKKKKMEPEDVFSKSELEHWATDNGFIEDEDDD